MTVTAALWTQTGSFTAQEDRALISALLGALHFVDLAPEIGKVDAGGGHGVVGSNDLTVTPGAGHSVDVAAGQAFVRGTQTAGQGVYLLGNDATVNLLVATPDATNPRIDLVQLRVTDDSGGAGVGTLDVKTGVPAGSPSPPTPDENALVLAEVLVPASAPSSANYTITDRRTRASALGGVQVVTSTTLPDPASSGMVVFARDTRVLFVRDNSEWVPLYAGTASGGAAWTSYTPSNSNITAGNASIGAAYHRVGRLCTVRYRFTFGTSGTAFTGIPEFGLPFTAAATQVGVVTMEDVSGPKIVPGACRVSSGASRFVCFHPGSAGTGNISDAVPFTWAAGDVLLASITYEVSG